MKLDIRTARGSPVDAQADEIAALLIAIALTTEAVQNGRAVEQPQSVSRWRAAGRAYGA